MRTQMNDSTDSGLANLKKQIEALEKPIDDLLTINHTQAALLRIQQQKLSIYEKEIIKLKIDNDLLRENIKLCQEEETYIYEFKEGDMI